MRNKVVNYFIVGVALLFIAAIIREIVVNRNEQAETEEQRQHVFCELLQEGMTYAEVHEILAQIGPIKDFGSKPNGTFTLRLASSDSKTLFANGVYLYFGLDGRYSGASIFVNVSDRVPLCGTNK